MHCWPLWHRYSDDPFGNTLGTGLVGVSGGRDEYLDYVTPGIILLAVAGAPQGTAISVAMDMTEGIIARFRAMAITRVAVLTGYVVGSLIQTMIAMAVVIGLALLLGFGPTAGPAGMRWFAEYQPFTPIMETLRGLLMGRPIGNRGGLAVGWCVAIGLAGYLWAKHLFNRDPTP